MAGRYTDIKPVSRCFSPVRVFRNGEYLSFPCGRCPACLLDKANDLSHRVADEIENTSFSIFFTLTYNNKYLPKLYYCNDDSISKIPFYYSNHFDNIRFDGVRDVRRTDNIFIEANKVYELPITNYFRPECISYSSKRDVILWLKLLRSDLDKQFDLLNKDEETRNKFRFRYFIISEYGPTSRRNHLHGLLFFHNQEASEYCLRISMYKNWQMCDKSLFDEHTHYCDSGAAEYVTNYLTCPDNLPQILKYKDIRPFRLSSKSPAIGYVSFNPEEIFESLFQGIGEYTKTIPRIETNYIFPYPSNFAHRLFPKCREYRLLSYKRLHYIYGFLWRNVVKRGFSYDLCNNFLLKKWYPADVTAAQKAYQFCLDTGLSVDCYLYLVDMYYYKEAMFALRKFYEWQEQNFDKPVNIAFSYTNFQGRVHSFLLDSNVHKNTLIYFCNSLGFDIYDYVRKDSDSLSFFDSDKEIFKLEVEDILTGMVKQSKFNELSGNAPHII